MLTIHTLGNLTERSIRSEIRDELLQLFHALFDVGAFDFFNRGVGRPRVLRLN